MVVLGEEDKEEREREPVKRPERKKNMGQFWPGVDARNATRRGDRWGAGVFGWVFAC